jgi:hypothetical protein
MAETDVVNSDDRGVLHWRERIARIIAVTGKDRAEVSDMIIKRIERDRKKKISPDKSIAQFAADTEAAGF